MSLHSRWEHGSLVFYDGATRLMAIPNRRALSRPEQVPNLAPLGLNYVADIREHFMRFYEDEWVHIDTSGGAGEGFELTDEHGGVLLLTTANQDEDETGLQYASETVLLDEAEGNDTWFAALFKVDDVAGSELNIGLIDHGNDGKIGKHHTADGGVGNGVYLHSPEGSAQLHGDVVKGGGPAQVEDLATLVDDTWIWAGFHFDASADTVQFSVSGVDVGEPFAVAADIPDDEELAVTFAVQTNAAASRELSVHAYRLVTQVADAAM